jgi:hypothetical protein
MRFGFELRPPIAESLERNPLRFVAREGNVAEWMRLRSPRRKRRVITQA